MLGFSINQPIAKLINLSNPKSLSAFLITNREISVKNEKRIKFGSSASKLQFLCLSEPEKITQANLFSEQHGKRSWGRRLINAANHRIRKFGQGEEDGHILFFVHGYNHSMQDAIEQHYSLQKQLETHGLGQCQLVSYAWPSNNRFTDYLVDILDAQLSALSLIKDAADLLPDLSRESCKIKFHILAHSMGAMLIFEAFHILSAMRNHSQNAVDIHQLIFVGADIDQDRFDPKVNPLLFQKPARISNYFNRADIALASSNMKRMLGAPRLGRHGTPTKILEKIADIDVSRRWQKLDRQVFWPDLTDVPASHSFYFSDPLFLQDLILTLKGDLDRRIFPTRDPHPTESGRLALKAGWQKNGDLSGWLQRALWPKPQDNPIFPGANHK